MWIPIAAIIGAFTFLSIAVWTGNRARERELYYKSELLKKAMETTGPDATAVLAYIKEEEARALRTARAEKRRGLMTGGLVVSGVGVGLMIFLYRVTEAHGVFLVGLIPLFVGLALLVSSRFVKDNE